MIKSWNQFIREFVESDNYIDSKMSELKDLIEGVSGGQHIIYEWENKNDHQLTVSFSTDGVSAKYEFDIDDLRVTKTVGESIDFDSEVDSVEEGLELIERDVQSILGISESYTGQWDSSIKSEDVDGIINKIRKCQIYFYRFADEDSMMIRDKLEKILNPYDDVVSSFIIDKLVYTLNNPSTFEDLSQEIVELGDDIMNKYGTEPRMVINAFNDCFSYLKRFIDLTDEDEFLEERAKAQRYKGRKIPGKYLTGPQPGKMKKEIDRYAGRDEYKKDWDADYKSGKGGKGKRVKTKKSSATKAYQRMFGKGEK